MGITTIKQRLKEIEKLKEKTLTEYCDFIIEKLTENVDLDELIDKLKSVDDSCRWINIWDDCHDIWGYTPNVIVDILNDIQDNLDISSLLTDESIIAISVNEEKRILTYEIINS